MLRAKSSIFYASRALSGEQKEYWGSMAGKVDTPLQYAKIAASFLY